MKIKFEFHLEATFSPWKSIWCYEIKEIEYKLKRMCNYYKRDHFTSIFLNIKMLIKDNVTEYLRNKI